MQRHNLRAPFIVGILGAGFVTVVGVIINNVVVTNVGMVAAGIVVIWASWALTFGQHTELLAGASEPVTLGKGGQLLVWLLGVILFIAGVSLLVAPWLAA